MPRRHWGTVPKGQFCSVINFMSYSEFQVGIAAVANFTVAFVWTIELGSGKWKVM